MDVIWRRKGVEYARTRHVHLDAAIRTMRTPELHPPAPLKKNGKPARKRISAELVINGQTRVWVEWERYPYKRRFYSSSGQYLTLPEPFNQD